jgi:hypothetical protein
VSPISAFGILSLNKSFKDEVPTQLGTFLAAVMHGEHGISAAKLLADEDRLSGAVRKMDWRYMALFMARKMRMYVGERLFKGHLLRPEARLKMSLHAKFGLQVLLGIFTVCGLASLCAMPTCASCTLKLGRAILLAWLVYWLDQRFGATGGEIREFNRENLC